MSLAVTLITGSAIGLSGASLLARITGNGGQYITQSSLSSISYVVSDLTAGTTGASVPVSVAATVFNSVVQNDPRWQRDSQLTPGIDGNWGYNFLLQVPANTFPVSVLDPTQLNPVPANHRMQVDVAFTPVTGPAFRVVWQFPAQAVYG